MFLFSQCKKSKSLIKVSPIGIHGIYGYDNAYSIDSKLCDSAEIIDLFEKKEFNIEKNEKSYYTIDNFIFREDTIDMEIEIISISNKKCMVYLRNINGLKTKDDSIFAQRHKEYRESFEAEVIEKMKLKR